MSDEGVESRLRSGAAALNKASYNRSAPPVERMRGLRRRRQLVGSAALVLVVVLGGFSLSRSARNGSIDTELMSEGFDQPSRLELGSGTALWPAQALPLGDLLDRFADDVLGWPGATWSELIAVPRFDDRFLVVVQTSDDVHTSLSFVVQERTGGWVVSNTEREAHVVLQDGNLVGVLPAVLGFVGEDTVTVDVNWSDSSGQHQTTFPFVDELPKQFDFPGVIEAGDAGSVLVLGRDAAGQATFVSGVALGWSDRLTVSLDSLGPGTVHVFPGAIEGVEVQLEISEDRSEICYRITRDASAASCQAANHFNQHGSAGALESEEDGLTWLVVVPDEIELGDTGGAAILGGGRVLVGIGIEFPDYTISDGVLILEE